MQNTLVGRKIFIQGLLRQVRIYQQRILDLRPWWLVAASVLLYVFMHAYKQEQEQLRAERVRPLKQEKILLDKLERQNVYEARRKRRWFGRLRGS